MDHDRNASAAPAPQAAWRLSEPGRLRKVRLAALVAVAPVLWALGSVSCGGDGGSPSTPSAPAPPVAPPAPAPPMVPTDPLGSPCAGIQIWAGRPERWPLTLDWLEWLRDDHLLTARIAIEWSREAANVAFDWAGSYRDWHWRPGAREPTFEHPVLDTIDVAVEGWEVEDFGDGLRHTMDIAWPERAPATFQFRSSDDACNGEPLLVCDRAACELRPS